MSRKNAGAKSAKDTPLDKEKELTPKKRKMLDPAEVPGSRNVKSFTLSTCVTVTSVNFMTSHSATEPWAQELRFEGTKDIRHELQRLVRPEFPLDPGDWKCTSKPFWHWYIRAKTQPVAERVTAAVKRIALAEGLNFVDRRDPWTDNLVRLSIDIFEDDEKQISFLRIRWSCYLVKDVLLKFNCLYISPRERDNVPVDIMGPLLEACAFEGLDVCGSFNSTNLFSEFLAKYKYAPIDVPVNAAAGMTEENSLYYRCA